MGCLPSARCSDLCSTWNSGQTSGRFAGAAGEAETTSRTVVRPTVRASASWGCSARLPRVPRRKSCDELAGLIRPRQGFWRGDLRCVLRRPHQSSTSLARIDDDGTPAAAARMATPPSGTDGWRDPAHQLGDRPRGPERLSGPMPRRPDGVRGRVLGAGNRWGSASACILARGAAGPPVHVRCGVRSGSLVPGRPPPRSSRAMIRIRALARPSARRCRRDERARSLDRPSGSRISR